MAGADVWSAHVARVAPEYQQVWASQTEAGFHEAVERAIECVLRTIEEARAEYGGLGETGLSKLTAHLRRPLVPAAAEKNRNGHVDFVVEHPRPTKRWVYPVECKIWRGHERHRGSMGQLLGYATSFDKRGMCLEFFTDHKRMVFLLERERQDVDSDVLIPVISPSGLHTFLRAAFVSPHEHSSGGRFEIVHFGCDLYSGG